MNWRKIAFTAATDDQGEGRKPAANKADVVITSANALPINLFLFMCIIFVFVCALRRKREKE